MPPYRQVPGMREKLRAAKAGKAKEVEKKGFKKENVVNINVSASLDEDQQDKKSER